MLPGTLTLDFVTPVPNPTPDAGFTFMVTDQHKVAGFTIPEDIRGGTFELNAECTNAIAVDNTGGNALLRLNNHKIGTVFHAVVTSGMISCLLQDGADRVDAPFDDPFICPGFAAMGGGQAGQAFCFVTDLDALTNSALGEGSVWFAQILQDPDTGGDVETAMRAFFEIPDEKTLIRTTIGTFESSQTSSGNRGGSAAGINNSDLAVTFKRP